MGGTLIQLSLVKQPWQLNLWRLSSSLASLLPRQVTAMESLSTLDTEPATQAEAPRGFPMAVTAMAVMEREMLSQATAMVVMVDMVPPLSLSPRPITAMATTSMVMERETLRLSQDTAMVPEATPTDPHRAWDMEDMDMEVMVDTVMERGLLMLSPVMDTELVTVLPPPLTIHMVVQAPPTEAPRDF